MQSDQNEIKELGGKKKTTYRRKYGDFGFWQMLSIFSVVPCKTSMTTNKMLVRGALELVC